MAGRSPLGEEFDPFGHIALAVAEPQDPNIFNLFFPSWEEAVSIPGEWKLRNKTPARWVDLGLKFGELLEYKTGLSGDPEGDRWIPRQPLGAGSFGAVGLFHKYDADGRVIDSVVIKTANAIKTQGVNSRLDLSMEAAIQAQLNRLNCASLLYLRNFKYYDQDNRWRYYLEHAPFGDLNQLRMRYKAFGYYLPELFLWSTFHGLVEGCKTMGKGPFRRLASNGFADPYPESFVLHNDIKPENVFSGRLGGGVNKLRGYPIPKISDFGLSQLTDMKDLNNLPSFNRGGSRPWKAPEIMWQEIREKRPKEMRDQEERRRRNPDPSYFSMTLEPIPEDVFPFQQGDPSQINGNYSHLYRTHDPADVYRIGPEANLYAIRLIMYQLLTLAEHDEASDLLREMIEAADTLPDVFNEAEREVTFVVDKIVTQHSVHGQREYSRSLRRLVCDCLKFFPEHRPDPEVLSSQIAEGGKEYYEDLLTRYPDPCDERINETKLYLTSADFNNLEQGPYKFPFDRSIPNQEDRFWDKWEEMKRFEDPDHRIVLPEDRVPNSQPNMNQTAFVVQPPEQAEGQQLAGTKRPADDQSEELPMVKKPRLNADDPNIHPTPPITPAPGRFRGPARGPVHPWVGTAPRVFQRRR